MKLFPLGCERQVRVTRNEVGNFNARWPCSELRATRSYWFQFGNNGDLIDTDVPEQDNGSAASAMVADCKEFIEFGTRPDWADPLT
jgi:hypothetical protein